MLASKLIPQVDPHVKIGSAKVSRKKTLKDYTFSLKLAKSQKGNFEQPPCASRLHTVKSPSLVPQGAVLNNFMRSWPTQ